MKTTHHLKTIEQSLLARYEQYINNTGGSPKIEQFDEDWSPVGPNVRKRLRDAKMIREEDGRIFLLKQTVSKIAKEARLIAKGAKSAPRKVGAVIDDYKEVEFLRVLREELPAEEFIITVHGSPIKGHALKIIIIERVVKRDVSQN